MAAEHSRPKKWILLRGLMRSRFHWLDFSEQLKSQLNLDEVFCVELQGNGFLSQEETPADISDVIKNMKAQIPFSHEDYGLLGISMGGMIATRWAQLYPDEVQALVLINSSSSLSPFYHRLMPRHYLTLLRFLAGPSDTPALEQFILSQTSNIESKWKPLLTDYIAFQRQHPSSLKNFARQLLLTSQIDFTKTPICPKLILACKQDRFVNSKCSHKIAQQWECPTFYHETAGHDLPLDDADWIIRRIQNMYSSSVI